MEPNQKRLSESQLSEWIDALGDFDIDSSTTEIAGVSVYVTEDSSPHSSDVRMSMTLVDYGVELNREGIKEISYDRWGTPFGADGCAPIFNPRPKDGSFCAEVR